MSDPNMDPAEILTGVLVSRDLIFNSKVTGTAQALGLKVVVAGSEPAVLQKIAESPVKMILIDLSAGEVASPSAIQRYDEAAPLATLIAFGSHVNPEALDAASQAGCDLVMPRSRFSAELPEILRRYLGK